MKPVIIVGAGVGGLALAQALSKRNIPFRIFERDPSLDARRQGYRFLILPIGVDALPSILDPQVLNRLEACSAINGNKGLHPSGFWNPLASSNEDAAGAPIGPTIAQQQQQPQPFAQKPGEEFRQALSMDRSVLRSVLSHGINVEWSRRLESFSVESDCVRARFSGGVEVEGSLLVGADGANSQVRKQMVADFPILDTEGRWFWGKTPITAELRQTMRPELFKGLQVMTDKSRPEMPLTVLQDCIRFRDNEFRSQLPADYIYWVLQANKAHFPDMSDAELLNLSPEDCIRASKSLVSRWNPEFRAAIDLQDVAASAVHPILSVSPSIPTWDGQGRVTCIGDAAHAMPPTTGSGATTTLRDVAGLAEALATCDGEKGVSQAIATYEENMRRYAPDVILSCEVRSAQMFGMKPFRDMETFSMGKTNGTS